MHPMAGEGSNGTGSSNTSWKQTLRRGRVVSPDGTGIAYEVVGRGSRALVVANGLGARLHALQPLIDGFWRDYRILTWDYRGLFESDSPSELRRLAIPNHVADAMSILEHEKIDRAVFVGWSMGVQVALDCAVQYPNAVAGLVLLNGTYGQVFSTGFQPLFALPWLPRRLHAVAEFFRKRPMAMDALARIASMTELPAVALMFITAGIRAAGLRHVLHQYYKDIFGPSFANYMRLFQELDAHSMYHLLPEIRTPALIVSGALDPLTPPFQSRQMARRMPNAQRLALTRASHFCILERPVEVTSAVKSFLDGRAEW